jgi:hypothetical protein
MPPSDELAGSGMGLATAARVSLVLSWLSLAAGLVLPVIAPSLGWIVPDGLPSELTWAAALLGLIGGGLALLAPPAPKVRVNGVKNDTALIAAELRATARELGDLLRDERKELATQRDSHANSAREAMVVGARLAGVVMDAEARLADGVARAEGAMLAPDGALARAGHVVQLIERVAPELIAMSAWHRDLPEDARSAPRTFERLVQTAEATVQGLAGTLTRATEQIDDLGRVSEALRHGADALGTAGRELAGAGTDTLARVGAVAERAEATLAQLPQAATSIDTAARESAQAIAEAAGLLAAAGREGARTVGDVREAIDKFPALSSSLDSAAARLATEAAGIATAGAEAARALADATATLRADGAALGTAVRDAAERNQAQAEIVGRLSSTAERIAATVTDVEREREATRTTFAALPDLISGLAAASDRIGALTTDAEREREATRSVLAALPEIADRLARETTALQSAGADADTRLAAAAADAEREREATRSVLAAFPDLADRVAREATALQSAGADAATRLAAAATDAERDREATRGVLAALPDLADRVAREAAALQAAGQGIVHSGTDLLARLTATAIGIGAVTADAEREREATRAVLASLPDLAGGLDAAARRVGAAVTSLAPLPDLADRVAHDTAMLRAAGQDIAQSGADIVARLADTAARIDVATADAEREREAARALLLAVPDAVAGLDAAAQRLGEETAALRAAGQRMSDGGADLVARLGDSVERIAVAAASAEREGEETRIAISTIPRLADRLADETAGIRLETAAMADAARTVAARAEQATDIMAAIPDLVARLDGAADRVRQEAAVLGSVGQGIAETGAQVGAELHDAAGQVVLAAAAADIRREETQVVLASLPRLTESLADAAAALRRDAAQAEQSVATLPPLISALGSVGAAMAALPGELSSVMARLEDAAVRHDAAGETLIAAMAKVETARQAVAAAEADARADQGDLVATLRHLAGVSGETELLARQAEALAESVLSGKAPALPPLLAARAPALLEQVEIIIQRLRSVATALALASDGPAGRAVA